MPVITIPIRRTTINRIGLAITLLMMSPFIVIMMIAEYILSIEIKFVEE